MEAPHGENESIVIIKKKYRLERGETKLLGKTQTKYKK